MLLAPVNDSAACTEIGARIRSARGKAKLTQKAVADALDEIDPGQVSRWEHGKGAPSVMQLLRIGERCNVRPETLIEGIVEPTWEQLTIGLDAEASAIVYDLAKALLARGRPVALIPVTTEAAVVADTGAAPRAATTTAAPST